MKTAPFGKAEAVNPPARSKTLLRVSHLRSHDISHEYANEILHYFVRNLGEIDFVVFSDFNYGALPQSLVDQLIQLCHEKTIPFFADSQSSSQVGNIARFKGANIVFATEREARIAVNDYKSGLQATANHLILRAKGKNLFLKLGPEGLLIISDRNRLDTQMLNAFNLNPMDVAGAGDAMLACSVLSSSAGGSIWESAYLGSLAAGIQVSRLGNLPIEPNELLAQISQE